MCEDEDKDEAKFEDLYMRMMRKAMKMRYGRG